MLRLLAAGIATLLLAAPAAADVRPLADRTDLGAPALNGDRVVYGDPGRTRLRVFEQPLAGGAATQLASLPTRRPAWDLAAGPDGLALRLYELRRRPQLLAGPPQGPLARVPGGSRGSRFAEAPDLFSVPGGPLVVDRERVFLRPPGGPARELAMPRGADLEHLAAAGNVLAVWTPTEIVLHDLPSGAVRSRLPLGDFARAPLIGLGVSEAGDVALVAEESGRDFLGWAPAGAAAPRIALAGDQFGHVATGGGLIALEVPAVAGDAARVVVLDPTSDPTRVLFRGPPAAAVRALDFDGRHVAWATDGCQLVADVGSPALRVIPAGPCARTEASFTQYVPSSVRYRIRCIATPGRRCRVDLRVYGSRLERLARRVVTIRRGRARFVHIPVSPRDDIFYTVGRVVDPDGRRRIAITF